MTGPTQVTAEQGGSLAVSCSYKAGYELYRKYWCRPGFLWFCLTYIAQTNGSEVTVTQGKVSIGDNHTTRSFTVMLDGVTPGDAGWYSCGVRRSLWFSLWHTTEVMVSTGKAGLGAKRCVRWSLSLGSQWWGQGLSSQGYTGVVKAGTSSLQAPRPAGAAPVQIWTWDGGGCTELHAEQNLSLDPVQHLCFHKPVLWGFQFLPVKTLFFFLPLPSAQSIAWRPHLHLLHLRGQSLRAETPCAGDRTGWGGVSTFF